MLQDWTAVYHNKVALSSLDWSYRLAYFQIFGILEEVKISKEILKMNNGMISVGTLNNDTNIPNGSFLHQTMSTQFIA